MEEKDSGMIRPDTHLPYRWRNMILSGLLPLLCAGVAAFGIASQAAAFDNRKSGNHEGGEVRCAYPEWKGQKMPADVVESIRDKRPVRVLRQGQPRTDDFILHRLNIILDDQGRVLKTSCG